MKKRVDFKEIKRRITMEQVLVHYGIRSKLKGDGDQLRGTNPFDSKNDNPSRFSVSLRKNCWNVWGTELSGNVIDFVKEKEGVSTLEAALLLSKWFPLCEAISSTEPKLHVDTANADVFAEAGDTEGSGGGGNPPLAFELKNLDRDHPYLQERGLSPETVEHFGLGFASRGLLKGRIAIPIRNVHGELVGYIGRYPGNPPEGVGRYRLPKGFKKGSEIFNLHSVISDPSDLLIVVEGAFDCFHLWDLGWRSVVSLMGSSLSKEQGVLLTKHWSGKILLMLDDDEAGQAGSERALVSLSRTHWIRTAKFPEEVQQPEGLSKEQLQAITCR